MLTHEVSILIPTRNRAHVLGRTLPSYICQDAVGEIIIVDDASTDNTKEIVEGFKKKAPVPIRYYKNERKKGAAGARNVAIEHITLPYAAWGEDDLIFGRDYIPRLLRCLKGLNADIVGGRAIYMLKDENEHEALARVMQMQNEAKDVLAVDTNLMEFNFSALPDHPVETPFLHAAILTKSSWLRRLKYDEKYGGNGYREETDFQVTVLKHGGKIFFCPDACCFHLFRADIGSGGQHDRTWINYEYWTIRNNNYFLDKHYLTLKERLGLSKTRPEMKWLFMKSRLKNYILPHLARGLIVEPAKRIQRMFSI